MKLKFDGKIEISTGRSRKELNWKNREWLWSDLVKKLQTTHRTPETHAEYVVAKKERQTELKDVGGFVGGYLANGKRSKNSVLHRHLITLDIDAAKNTDAWDNWLMLFGNAAACYSTHSHSEGAPRLRLIIPLDREVNPTEYQAIARRITGDLGIEQFDTTTYQAERLMYWPSTSKDGDYYFRYEDAAWLSADDVLAMYRDWTDTSEWPMSDKENKIVLRAIKKQGDPLEKAGIVGAFCRSYDIHEGIKTFLPDVYTQSDDKDSRYTFVEGTSSNGLITYDDKYAFSHHGTDPISGKLCNAFDLVRIHLFGLKDEDAKEGTPINKLPSFTAMSAMAMKDHSVKKQISQEKLADAARDFEGLNDDEAEALEVEIVESAEWMSEMDIDGRGNYLSTVFNLKTILEHDPKLKGRIAYNEFSRKANVMAPLPWDKKKFTRPREWDDDDLSSLRNYISLPPYSIQSVARVGDVLADIRRDNAFHPVKDYLKSLEWDGKHRLDTLYIDYLGVEDSAYTRAITRKSLVAAVARIWEPGCKFDYVLTLIGKEGQKKSSIYRILGKEWFTDTFNFSMLHNGKQAYEQIQGFWIIEIPEMAGLKKAELEAAKSFVTSGSDNYRASHKMETLNRPRQNVFYGTSNNYAFMKAASRRFWPAQTYEHTPTKNVSRDLTDSEVDQIWAEAMVYYKKGELLYLNEELEEVANAKQKEHAEEDERTGMILKYLETPLPANWNKMGIMERRGYLMDDDDPLRARATILREKVCAAEIWCEVLGGMQKDMTNYNTKFIHEIMEDFEGWERPKSPMRFNIYGLQRGYSNPKNVNRNRKNLFTGGHN